MGAHMSVKKTFFRATGLGDDEEREIFFLLLSHIACVCVHLGIRFLVMLIHEAKRRKR